MADRQEEPATERHGKRLYQCPGCWATAVLPSDNDWECDNCGEALQCVDLREALDAAQMGNALRSLAGVRPGFDARLDAGDYGHSERPSEFAARLIEALSNQPSTEPKEPTDA